MQVVADIYPHAHIMHRFPTREQRSKPKSHITPIYSTRPRSLSAISLLQPSQIHARASSVVRKVLGARSPLKEPVLFGTPTERNSCDKPRSSADSTRRGGSRPRSNTTPTEITWPKDVTIPPANHDTFSATPCTSGPTQTAPVNSLLFSPTPSTPSSDDQEMESTQTSPKRPSMTQGSPEIDSGYASGHSSAAGSALPTTNNSPVIARTPRTLGKVAGAPLTPGGMNMRLSPSLPRSIMPMPILNLPPLPPTPVRDHTLPRARSLHPEEMRHVKKSMPALMRHGTSNMAITHAEEDDDDGSSDGSDSDSSDAEETTPDGESSPDAHDSIDESIEESTSHSGSEADYFDARETHTPAAADDLSGLATPRASDQHRTLGETSALGLQITPTPGPSTIAGSSPWTMVDVTPGVDRAASGHPPRTDYFSHPIASARQALKSPHRTPRVSQLISLASPRANGRSPQATTTPLPPPNTIAARRARAATVLRDPNGESPRPTLYQQVSQSMMNLTSPPSERTTLTGLDDLRAPCERMPTIAATPGTPAPPATPLMRRNSMPTMIKHPPSYNELYSSVPREEEGKEKLPGYSCGIHIEAMMPRKMEFSAPGVLAKDRGWKKQYIVIHGTSLMVYKYDIRKVPIGGKVKGKEKYEGVVTEDEVDLNSPTVHLPGHESAAARVPLNPPTRRGSRRAASVGTSDNGSRSSLLSRFHGNSSRSAVSQPQETPVPAPDDKASASESTVSISASNSTSASNRRWSHNQASVPFASSLPHFNPPFSSGNQLIRQYTLQRAESGLGSDYYKRRNVIRVRCEGEQFLLQAESVMQVVDWIECLQAGTNAALDLDERPMTKPPPFPRRRRRRRARPADGSNANGASGASNTNDNTPSR